MTIPLCLVIISTVLRQMYHADSVTPTTVTPYEYILTNSFHQISGFRALYEHSATYSIIIIIIIIFINCNWVVTRWQWLFNTYTKH
jgi:hypothetical protein